MDVITIGQPPLATLFDATTPRSDASQPHSTEEKLAMLLEKLMRDIVTPAAVVQDLIHLSQDDAMHVRQECGQWMHRVAKAMQLQITAADLEAQAATWRLVHHLYCVAAPAGVGGPRPTETGTALVARQHAVDIIPYDAELDRCARVVSWLEELASEQMGEDTLEGFAQGEGLPFATMARHQQPGRQGRALDPDAPWREGLSLEAEDRKNNERVMQRIWSLIRAGRLREGVQLAVHVGQEWRAASLMGGGQYGPLPVGHAADSQDVGTNVKLIFEELAAEMELGESGPSTLWKWSCYQASRRSDPGHAGASYEVAVYAALSGNLQHALAVCGSWEDAAWAHCRCLLDLSLDQELGKMFPPPPPDPLEMGADELLEVLRGIDDGVPLDEGALVQGLAITQAASWPTPELLEQLTDLPGVFRERLPALPRDSIRKACTDKYHTLQVRLILGELLEMLGADMSGDLQAVGGPWQLQPGAESLGRRPYLLLRFSAHLSLMLRALGRAFVVYEAPDEGLPVYDYKEVAELSDKLLVLYCAQLLESGLHAVVPHYAVHLRAFMRAKVLLQLLAAATTVSAEGAPDGDPLAEDMCREVWSAVRGCCEQASRRQMQLLEHEEAMAADGEVEPGLPEGLVHHLATDVNEDELCDLLNRLGVEWVAYGPMRRVRTARWLFYPYLDELAGGGMQLEVHDMVLQHVLGLAHSLACCLDAPSCASAAYFLAHHVVPREFPDWLAASLQQRIQDLQSDLESGEGGGDEAIVRQSLDHMEATEKLLEAVGELQQLLGTFRHHSAVDEWQVRAGGEEVGDVAGLVEEGSALLQETQILLEEGAVGFARACDELMRAVEANGGLSVAMVVTLPGQESDTTLLDRFPPLQESQAAEVQHLLDVGMNALSRPEGQEGEAGSPLVSVQMAVSAEQHLGYVTLQLVASEPSPQAVQQLLDIVSAALCGLLPDVQLPPLMLVDFASNLASLVAPAVSGRVVAARLLAAVQTLRLGLLALGAAEDPAPGFLQLLAEPDSTLEQVSRDVPKEVLQETLQREVDVQVALMQAAEARVRQAAGGSLL